jgi:branched-chain amino acid transport system permease protein
MHIWSAPFSELGDPRRRFLVSTFLQHLIQGTTLGATYALVALGFSMQFSAMNLVNFAHGESFMLGAFVALVLLSGLGGSYLLAFIGAVVILGVFGAIIERISIRPLYGTSELNLFVATIGLSILLRQVGILLFGADAVPFSAGFGTSNIAIGPAVINRQQLGIIVAAVLFMVGLNLLLRRTKLGVAMRAVAQDPATAALMGINVPLIKTLVYGVSTSLGAAAGILFASLTFAVFDMGLWMGIKGFTAAVVGGLGSLPGAVLGGLLLGLIEQLSAGYISSLYRDAISLSVLILVLLVLPAGLMGRRGSTWGKV